MQIVEFSLSNILKLQTWIIAKRFDKIRKKMYNIENKFEKIIHLSYCVVHYSIRKAGDSIPRWLYP